MKDVNYYKKVIETGEKQTIPYNGRSSQKNDVYKVPIERKSPKRGLNPSGTEVSKVENPSQFESD